MAGVDETLRFKWVNASWDRDLGWTPLALQHSPLESLVHPEDLTEFRQALSEPHQETIERRVVTRMRDRDGGWHWVDWFQAPMDEGLFYGRDVTSVMLAEQALDRQTQLVTLDEEATGIGHWTFDPDTMAITWSPQIYRIHGVDPLTFVPTFEAAVAAYHPEDRERVVTLIGAAVERAEPFDFELCIMRPNGEVRHVLARGRADTASHSKGGRLVLGTFLDVTEHANARAQRARDSRLANMGMLAAGVGHEMNNPLTYICANVDGLIEDVQLIAGLSPSGRLREILSILTETREGLERLRAIVRGLRAFAREDAPPGPTNLRAVIEVALNMSMHEVRHRATCVVESEPAQLVVADESRLAQVMVNLICNAAQAFTESDPLTNRITIESKPGPGDTLILSVSDNGPGIPDAIVKHIFDPFFTTKPIGEGTGLGLAISQSIIASFGGVLTCKTATGGGTTFTTTLKLADGEPALQRDRPTPRINRLAGQVVLIDDEAPLLGVLERFLQREVAVKAFGDSREALAYLRDATDVSLVLCDLMMPHLTGMKLFREIERHRPDLAPRFVFMSGGTTREEVRAFITSVDNERLDKPFELHTLRSLVRRILGRQ
jgi:PAS domain S-box-containing protein